MSGIAGILHLDGHPADRAALARMMARLAHRGPDSSGFLVAGEVALGHLALQTTPESRRESQPWTDESGRFLLTLDGRIDNRDELRDALTQAGIALRTDTDAELVLRAYQCWGEGCPVHLGGDFAFALWDGAARRLLCARDHLPARPFYYYADRRLFLFASEPCALLAHPAVGREINEGMVAEYLANDITSQEETLYRDIRRLPPAHVLTVDAGGWRMRRYWDVDLAREVRHRTDADYAEHFRALLDEAVRARLRSDGPVAAELSGGLDSSSVVGLAQRLFRSGAAPDRGFETFSLTFPGRACDERPYIDAVVGLWGLKAHCVDRAAGPIEAPIAEVRDHGDFPAHPNHSMFDQANALIRRRGFRVLLSGLGGDDWLGEEFAPYADLLREGRLAALVAALRAEPSLAAAFVNVREAAGLLLPGLRRAYRRLRWREGVPSWIDRAFATRIGLADRLRAAPPPARFTSFAQRALAEGLRSGEQAHGYEMADRTAARFGFELRQPFNDRRVIEFCLALPQDQRQRGNLTKFILRRALGDDLPEPVRARRTKADFSHLLAESLLAPWARAILNSLDSSEVVTLGWVDRRRVQEMYGDLTSRYRRGDAGYEPLTWPLWMTVGIELWLRAALSPPAPLDPEPPGAAATFCTERRSPP